MNKKRFEVDSVIPEKGRKDSFWFYGGTVAKVTDTKTKRSVLIYASGEISITFQDNEETYKNSSAIEEAIRRKYTDKDLKNTDKVGWNFNNWFELEMTDKEGKLIIPSGDVDVCYDLTEAIQTAKKYLKETK